jgi:hypothetical protein
VGREIKQQITKTPKIINSKEGNKIKIVGREIK